MHQERNKRIACILFAGAVILLLLLFSFMYFVKKETKEELASDDRRTVVLNGMELYIPSIYHYYPDDSTLVLYDDSGYSMRLAVLEDSFEEIQLRKEDMLAQLERKGYTCLTSMEEWNIDNRPYLSVTIDNGNYTWYVIYSGAGEQSHFSVLVNAENQTMEKALNEIHEIINSAQETEKADTNIYDMFLEQAGPIEQEFHSEGIFQEEQGEVLISYGIPEGFYASAGKSSDMHNFVNRDSDIYVSLYLKQEERTAEEYILGRMDNMNVSQLHMEQTTINGKTVMYFSEQHQRIQQDEREQYYQFYAVIDLGEGWLYWLDGWSAANEKALDAETYTEFLTIEKLN